MMPQPVPAMTRVRASSRGVIVPSRVL